ncbi:uncharacterized protein ccdc15 [Polypterus senegalus]|nr:uncharacterized protein ccdc15 [Polypterus senegalus]
MQSGARIRVVKHKVTQNRPTIPVTRPQTFYKDVKHVLAGRCQLGRPEGTRVEYEAECQEHAGVTAMHTEERLKGRREEMAEHLCHFQEEVRRRVARQYRIRKKLQVKMFSETAESEGRLVQQLCNASQRLSPQKTAQRHHMQSELAICGPSARFVSTRSLIGSDNAADGIIDSDHTKQLSKVMKQARHRLASCQTLPMENSASELPGGVWRVSPTRDKSPGPLLPPTGCSDDDDDDDVEDYTEEIPLAAQHDLPLYMQGLTGSPKQTGRTVNFQDVLVCDRSEQERPQAGPSLMESISTLPPWADVNQEDIRKQRQAQFLMYRRLFMDIEREQVKEQRRHREHLQRISSIKQEKERQRRDEERRMQQPRHFEEDHEDPGKTEKEVLVRLQLEEREARERKEKQKKAQKRESFRFIEALRAMMKEKIEHHNFDLPPLCCCGESFWDSHPDTCANNCVFYKNPKAYAKALQAVLSSCDLWEGGLGHRACVQKIASASARSPKK